MKKVVYFIISAALLFSCSNKTAQPVYQDVPYLQDYSIKYYFDKTSAEPQKVSLDRNGVIQVLAKDGLYIPHNGHFQHPGSLQPDTRYRPMKDKKVADMTVYENQFVYLDDEAVFSNAWAGKLYSCHNLPQPRIVCGGKDFTFLISDGKNLVLLKDSKSLKKAQVESGRILDIKYDPVENQFFVLSNNGIYRMTIENSRIDQLLSRKNLTCFEISQKKKNIIVGTNDGYFQVDKLGKHISGTNKKLPWTELTTIKEINGKLWFGSTMGAFMLRDDGKFNYYFGERWLPGNIVTYMEEGSESSVLILTNNGLGKIGFKKMTLEDKALFYEKQVRQYQIRYGVNSNVTRLQNHDLSTAENHVADSDNLWTGMYLGSQLFRYLATGSQEAKQNCYEAFEVMERFHQINGITGLFGRSIERRGYHEFRQEFRSYVDNYWYEGYQGTVSWRHADDGEWDWRASASSDQTVGQIFALTLIAEYIDDDAWRVRAIKLLDDLMTYIVENDMCLVDYNGLPSLWGRWNPQYVNRFDTMVGDRKVCSSNIIAFLQSAYKHTGKELFKEKAFELMNDHGYLENLTRPFEEIGSAPEDADDWSKMLSEEWNHSDDEMYFLAYWALYPYAFNDSLKQQFKEAIKDHWEWERPEKNALWNFCYAMTGATEFDLEESIWHLKEFPLDMIQFENKNSHRKDIEFVERNFWGQLTEEVLPPDERPELKHNRNLFTLDGGDRQSLLSAGDTFLLPYWMGRFLGVISEPVSEKS